MVHFNELKITPDAKKLIIDVSVLKEDYYKDVYLDSIIIDSQDTYVGNYPSSEPLYQYTIPDIESQMSGKTVYQKHIRLVLDTLDLPLNNLLFVYVTVKGTPTPDTPCGCDNIVTLKTVVNLYPFYQQAMAYIKDIAKVCSNHSEFADFILRLKALQLAITTGHYTDAIKYYNKFFKGKEGVVAKKGGCSCGNT